jgi:hypothetical protein
MEKQSSLSNRALPATPIKCKMVTASVLLPGIQTPWSTARDTSAASSAAAAAHVKPGDVIYMHNESALLNSIGPCVAAATVATTIRGHCKAANQRGIWSPIHGTTLPTKSTRDTQGNCIFVSNALSASLSMPFEQVYDVATASEKEDGGPIYAQAWPQPILGEPTYRPTYLSKCDVGAQVPTIHRRSSSLGCSSSEETTAKFSQDDEDGYACIGGGVGDADDGSVYSHLFWGGHEGVGDPVYSHLLLKGGGDDIDDCDYSLFSRNEVAAESKLSDGPADRGEGVAEDDWATVMGSQVRRNGVRSGSRGSWSTVGATDGVTLIEALERVQSTTRASDPTTAVKV